MKLCNLRVEDILRNKVTGLIYRIINVGKLYCDIQSPNGNVRKLFEGDLNNFESICLNFGIKEKIHPAVPTYTHDRTKTTVCIHVWKTYNSGFTAYQYCEKCDEKRDIT